MRICALDGKGQIMSEEQASFGDGIIAVSDEIIDGCYTVMLICPRGSVVLITKFDALDDDAALVLAQGMLNEHTVELWQGLRFIERFDLTVQSPS
jgi:hypothetical protein